MSHTSSTASAAHAATNEWPGQAGSARPAPALAHDQTADQATPGARHDAALREMAGSFEAQLDALYAERETEALELAELRLAVASLTEQLSEFYALQERLGARSLADLVASAAPAPSVAPRLARPA